MKKIMRKEMNKRAQITIFVIIALIIVIAIFLIFILIRNNLKSNSLENPQTYIEDCAFQALKEAETTLLKANGYYSETTTNVIIYEGEKVPYLCKISEFYIQCMPQEPMFTNKMKNEIEQFVKPRVEKCFQNLEKSYKRKSYDIEEGDLNLKIVFNSNSIKAELNKKFIIQKDQETKSFENFEAEMDSPLNLFLMMIYTVVNYESSFCEFNYLSWMLEFPSVNIERFRTSDQSKIYTFTEKNTGKSISFAIKTCVMPAGI